MNVAPRSVRTLLSVSLLVVASSACVSNKPASYLVPELGDTATLVAPAVIVACSFVTNNRDLWFKGSSVANCLEPRDNRSSNAPVVDTVSAGDELRQLRALYMNAVDTARCLLSAEVNDGARVYVWDMHVEILLGVKPNPRRESWYCHSVRNERHVD